MYWEETRRMYNVIGRLLFRYANRMMVRRRILHDLESGSYRFPKERRAESAILKQNREAKRRAVEFLNRQRAAATCFSCGKGNRLLDTGNWYLSVDYANGQKLYVCPDRTELIP
jgi:hypothetical protein